MTKRFDMWRIVTMYRNEIALSRSSLLSINMKQQLEKKKNAAILQTLTSVEFLHRAGDGAQKPSANCGDPRRKRLRCEARQGCARTTLYNAKIWTNEECNISRTKAEKKAERGKLYSLFCCCDGSGSTKRKETTAFCCVIRRQKSFLSHVIILSFCRASKVRVYAYIYASFNCHGNMSSPIAMQRKDKNNTETRTTAHLNFHAHTDTHTHAPHQ